MSFVVSPRERPIADSPPGDGAVPPGRPARAAWLALLVLMVGVLVTLAAGAWLQRIDRMHDQEVIDQAIGRITAVLEASLEDITGRLRSVAAFIGASEHVSLAEWQTYVSVSALDDIEALGAAGLAYAPRVTRAQRVNWEHAMTYTHNREIRLRAGGEHETFPVQLVAPINERMASVLGFDLATGDARRAAIEAATTRAEVVLSGPVVLQDGGDSTVGGIFIMPVAHVTPRLASGNLRRNALRGLVALGLRYEQWIASVAVPWRNEYALELVDETGRCLRDDQSGYRWDKARPILTRLRIKPPGFLHVMQGLSKVFSRAVGRSDQLDSLSERLKLKWVKGHASARRVFE